MFAFWYSQMMTFEEIIYAAYLEPTLRQVEQRNQAACAMVWRANSEKSR